MTLRGYAVSGVCGLVALSASFAAGRYSTPVKVIERTVTVEKTVRDEVAIAEAVASARARWQKEIRDRSRITRTFDAKTGKKTSETIARDVDTRASGETLSSSASSSSIASHEATERKEEKIKIAEGARPRLAVGLSVPAPHLDALSLRQLGAEADVRIIGTLWLGLRYIPPPDGRGDWRDRLRLSAKLEF